jgi:hypothetical protein
VACLPGELSQQMTLQRSWQTRICTQSGRLWADSSREPRTMA